MKKLRDFLLLLVFIAELVFVVIMVSLGVICLVHSLKHPELTQMQLLLWNLDKYKILYIITGICILYYFIISLFVKK